MSTDQPIQSRKDDSQMKMGALAIATDEAGTLFVDGAEGTKLVPDLIVTLSLVAGQHFVELRDDKGQKLWEKVIVVPAGAQAAEKIELRSKKKRVEESMAPVAQHATTVVPVGPAPSSIAVNTATNRIYVAHYSSDKLTVIDGATNSIGLVTTGKQPNFIAVNPSTNRIYVTNEASNDVSVIDGGTNSVTTLSTGIRPTAAAVNSSTNKIYISNSGSDSITVIDGLTNKTHAVRVCKSEAIAVNEVRNIVYIACGDSMKVAVMDGAKDKVKTFIDDPHWMHLVVDQGANRIYTGGMSFVGGHAGAMIDGNSNVSKMLMPPTPLGFVTSIAVNPVTHKAYYYNFFGRKGDSVRSAIAIVDGSTNEITEIKLKSLFPGDVAINSMTNKIYVTNYDLDYLTEIDGVTNATSIIASGKGPSHMAINPITNKIYVLNRDSKVTVIDCGSKAKVGNDD